MLSYIAYNGKLATLDDSGDWNTRTSRLNNALKSVGITGVDFRSSSWPNQLASQNIKIINKKEDANKIIQEYKVKADATKAAEEKAAKTFAALPPATKIATFEDQLNKANQIGYANLTVAQKTAINNLSDKVKVSSPKNFNDAANNYYIAIAAASVTGAENLTQAQKANLQKYATDLKGFDSKTLGQNAKTVIANSQTAIDAINEIDNQKKTLATQKSRVALVPAGPQREAEQGKVFVEEDKLNRLISTANQSAPSYLEAFKNYGVSDFTTGLDTASKSAAGVTSGLADFSSGKMFSTGDLASKLNVQVTDAQILDDINTARKNQYKSLYDTGVAATTDLQSQLANANQFVSSLPTNDPRRTEAQKTITDLNTKIAQAQKDTLQAKSFYDGYKPISGTSAATTVAKFRETLQLPEERTMAQIDSIDPTLGKTVRSLADQYKTMAETKLGPTTDPTTEQLRKTLTAQYGALANSKLGPTTDPATEQLRKTLTSQYSALANAKLGATTTAQTEALRSSLEQEAANQLKLGSTLGAAEQRQYQQAARAAQTARGNIFGVAPAVQEAVETGAAGEARKLARYGAASQFLGSGQTTGDALSRDVALRAQLESNRLGAVTGFMGSGQTTTDAMARDVALRDQLNQNRLGSITGFMGSGQSTSDALARDVSLRSALDQSRLGAAQQFAASGPSVYNLSSQRLGQQQNLLNNYLAASAPQGSTGFAATPTATAGYQYVNPNAGFQGAQNATSIYNTLANLSADNYRTMMSGFNASQQPQQSGTAQFAQIAGGIGNIFSPISSAFKSYSLGGAA
jgi:hypothetical protein